MKFPWIGLMTGIISGLISVGLHLTLFGTFLLCGTLCFSALMVRDWAESRFK